MALPIPLMRLIIREHKKEPFTGVVLTLGRMAVLAPYEQVLTLFKEEGVEPKRLDGKLDKRTNIPALKDSQGKEHQFTSDAVFFKLLGIDHLEAIDISNYEHAEHIHDMNTPVPKILVGRFDAIFDFGTTEHIFDTKQTLDNISQMLKPGGRVLHFVPATNRIGHGYYMFSPCLFYDYYWANKFTDCQAYLTESGQGDPSFIKWKLFQYDYNAEISISNAFKSRNTVGVFFIARKTESSTFGVTPIQYQFMDRFTQQAKASQPNSSLDSVKKRAPTFMKKLYYRFQLLTKIRNGGLKYLGKI